MDDNWNELMERETQQFQADMQRETIDELTAENAKLHAQLAEAVAALRTLNDEMSAVAYSGFDPERWGERIGALDAAGRVLAKHTTT